MPKTVVSLYEDFLSGQRAVHDLLDAGFAKDDISLVVNQPTSTDDPPSHTDHNHVSRAEEAGISAGAGALAGGVGGLLLGLGLVTIPGVGPALAAGPIVATLAGIGLGTAVGGLSGALFQMGVPEREAGYYAEGVQRGGTLVAVTVADTLVQQAALILHRHNPVDIKARVATWDVNHVH